ncbi:hypothetical protein KC19_VG316300 [Ceratodon purpureus]|uniref:Uncharacterized protein n=1 Tax=Ceratodon purpureus TaxID=3225 RepID=A0A8T0HWI7_CERPU|nr:hypothetical protein KC19_VG316300 [Ceratodon purpureus]
MGNSAMEHRNKSEMHPRLIPSQDLFRTLRWFIIRHIRGPHLFITRLTSGRYQLRAPGFRAAILLHRYSTQNSLWSQVLDHQIPPLYITQV